MSELNASEYFQKCADYASHRCMERNKDFNRCMEEDKYIFIQDYNNCRTMSLEVPLLLMNRKNTLWMNIYNIVMTVDSSQNRSKKLTTNFL